MTTENEFLGTISQYNQTRDLARRPFYSVCYAPFISLYFDQLGNVRACCQNTRHSVGNITHQTLDEIWRGNKINELRDALVSNELRKGCQFCEWHFLDGNPTGNFMKRFDILPADSARPAWPQMMEFSISNTCNLECVMCNGEWSSLIRTRREKKPPLPKPYGDAFFEQLAKYLPHLKRANFLGGEPFLQREVSRIWDMMIDQGLQTPCHVTTNGTQFNDKVRRYLEHLPFDIGVSCDGITKTSLEAIRVNTDFDEWMTNFKHFREYTNQRKTSLGINFCLMKSNWREFMDLLLFAEDWNVCVCVNVVTHPPAHSLYQLEREELREIIDTLEAQERATGTRLKINRDAWDTELTRLRTRYLHVDEARGFQSWGYNFRDNATPNEIGEQETRALELLADWAQCEPSLSIDCDTNDVVSAIRVLAPHTENIPWSTAVGKHVSSINDLLCAAYDRDNTLLQFEQDENRIDIIHAFGPTARPKVTVRALTLPLYDDAGQKTGTRTMIAFRPGAPENLVPIDALKPV